ncbi:MAG: hypothetical protein GY777_15990 [Candidatus Brocadiaceae bacterium]|nr:hypothetical protein [Candidatus Brocadiaceae bacterium]
MKYLRLFLYLVLGFIVSIDGFQLTDVFILLIIMGVDALSMLETIRAYRKNREKLFDTTPTT